MNNALMKTRTLPLLFSMLLLPALLLSKQSTAQQLSLQDALFIAHTSSLKKEQVYNAYKNKYWRYRSYKKSLLPKMELNGSIPDLNIGLSPITLDDGTSAFIRSSQMFSNLSLKINQPIGLTGGRLFISSEIARLDLLGNTKRTSYQTNPLYLGFSQPLFQFNPYKWDKKIEPLVYEEAIRSNIEETEQISIELVNLFFNVINYQSRVNIAALNVENSDTLYKISQGRYKLGKIAENELLQMELTLLNAQKAYEQSLLDLDISMQALQSYLKIPYSEKITPFADTLIPLTNVPVDQVVQLAKENRSEFISYQRQIMESKRELDKVIKNNTFNLSLFAAYGLTQTAPYLNESYQSPLDKESIQVGIRIPIYNWGLSKANIEQQKANTELVMNQIEQAEKDFERQLFIYATRFNMLSKQIEIAQKAMEVAKKRYTVSKQRYMIGKSDIQTFNNSLKERDQAVEEYYQTIQTYWNSYFLIRQLTHYDFLSNSPLESEYRKG